MSVATQPQQKSKIVRIYRNGDPNYPAHAITVNTHQTRSWDAFLDNITRAVKPTFGTVFRLYNPETGRVVKDFSKLRDGKPYVAAGREAFKRLSYEAIVDPKMTMMKNKTVARIKTQGVLPALHDRVVRSGRAKRLGKATHALTVSIAVNGDVGKAPIKVLINARIRTLEVLLDTATRKLQPKFGCFRKLVTLEGKRIKSLDDLTPQGQYVGVGPTRFRRMPYFEPEAVKFAKTAPAIKTSPMKAKAPSMMSRNKTMPPPATNKPPASNSYEEQHMPKPKPVEKVQSYNVTVETGDADGQGTDANVFITLVGAKKRSKRTMLREDPDNFTVGAMDIFALESVALGDLQKIVLEHDDSGPASAWFVKRVSVRDSVTNTKVYFHVQQWLASDRNNAKTKIEVPASSDPNPPVAAPSISPSAPKDDVFAAKTASHEAAEAIEDSTETVEDRPEEETAAETVDEPEEASNIDAHVHAPVDDVPEIVVADKGLDQLEGKIHAAMQDKAELKQLWSSLDYNGNNVVSLAEIDKWVGERFPVLDSKPAMMRAYKKTTLRDGDGDAWVEKKEFPALLLNLFYFTRLFKAFDAIDQDDDRRVDFAEFRQGLSHIGMTMDEAAAQGKFAELDTNDGGLVLFDEFAAWAAREACPVNDDVMKEFTNTDERPVDDSSA